MSNWQTRRQFELAALLLGASLTLAFAPFGLFPLAIIAPAGLLALIQYTDPRRASWLGFLFGLGLFSTGVYWIYISIHQYGDAPMWLAGLITGGVIAILALFPASVCYFTQRYFSVSSMATRVFAFPAIWLLSEWIRSWIACGFPWLFIGYSQNISPLKGYAPIFSVYGTTLATLMCAGLLVHAVHSFKHKAFRSFYFSMLGIASLWIVGAVLCLIPWTSPSGKPLTVSLVQGNIPQSVKWDPSHIDLSFQRYETLTAPLWGKNDLIVWPEAAIPMSLQEATQFIDAMDHQATTHNTALILGIPIQNPNGNDYYNAVITLGEKRSMYLKRRLVPYGEYVPFQQLSSRVLSFMDVPMANMRAGEYNQKPLLVKNTQINTSICFEIAFPELVNTQNKDVGVLLTVTNDAWFGHSTAQAQHLQMAEMRAIELGRPVLFSSNDGITAIINPQGSVTAEAPAHVPFVLKGTIQPMTGFTPWMHNGMDPILAILLCFLYGTKRAARLNIEKQREPNGRTLSTTSH